MDKIKGFLNKYFFPHIFVPILAGTSILCAVGIVSLWKIPDRPEDKISVIIKLPNGEIVEDHITKSNFSDRGDYVEIKIADKVYKVSRNNVAVIEEEDNFQ